jgi:hypothetical protein
MGWIGYPHEGSPKNGAGSTGTFSQKEIQRLKS